MKLNALQPKEGSTKKAMRVGRGIGSGKGKTSGSGQKGQKSRSGVAIKGFEGGQMPLERRLPKFGFNNKKFATNLVEVSLGKLQAAIDSKKLDAKKAIDEKALKEAGVINNIKDGVKLLGTGTLSAKVELKITKATASAKAAVEKAGGKIDFIVREVKPVVRKDGKGAKK
ncbi:MAG: 50S ribosomal protein L15 [Alphaproteobacteria bacterium]|nr:50S ribosomal protein L15 [Alphaproteobacteria bacterium]MCD8570431.1 50S ribosomal protein L15 [Alphaproteobacteria bacterium]